MNTPTPKIMEIKVNIIDVTTENVDTAGVFCIKDKKAPGFKKKVDWFKDKLNNGLVIKIVTNREGKQLGFIEYIPSELAWRPIKAKNYLFIQCIVIFSKDIRNKQFGSELLKICEEDARAQHKTGVCTMSSKGPWIANKSLFEKNGYSIVDQLDRFELMCKTFGNNGSPPKFYDWTAKQADYKGWNLLYSDQCPWHEKTVEALDQSAAKSGIKLNIKKLETPSEAQKSPSGYGTFALLKDGKLLSDHYLSKTRFETILKKEI